MSFASSPKFEESSQEIFSFPEMRRTDTFSLAEDEDTPISSPPFLKPNSKPSSWCVLMPQGALSEKLSPIFISEPSQILGRADFPCEHASLISANHFRIYCNSNLGKKYVIDLSNNGLYLNGSRISKTEATPLKNGDILSLRISKNLINAIQLEFLDLTCNEDFDRSHIKSSQISSSPRFSQSHLEPILTCNICLETIYIPIALYPCVHNFCCHCFSEYYKKSDTNIKCPVCRQDIEGIQWNFSLDKIIEKLFEKRPNLIRTESFISASVASREFIQRLIDDKTLDHSSRLVKRLHTTYSVQQHDANRFQAVDNTCRACIASNSSVSNVMCQGSRQVHVNCQLCYENMPNLHEPSQSCYLCGDYYCNQFWDCNYPNANLEFNRLNLFSPETFPIDWKTQDPLEEEVYKDYLKKHNWKPHELFRFCLGKFQSGDFLWQDSILCIQQSTLDSFVCKSCLINTVLPEFGLFHRISLKPNQMNYPPGQSARPYCPSGRNCLRIPYDRKHQLMYNHWCFPIFTSGAKFDHTI